MTSVELVVDLALIEVIQRRTGVSPGWIFLDEAFNGQGNVTKEACLEVLNEFSSNKTVLVVDHASEFKEFFSTFIEIERVDGLSRIG